MEGQSHHQGLEFVLRLLVVLAKFIDMDIVLGQLARALAVQLREIDKNDPP